MSDNSGIDVMPHSGRATCRCGVWEWAHREGRGCGNFRKASRVRVWLQHHSVWAHLVAPVWLRLSEKRRWTVVHWLNKSRRQCWSALVSDALAYREDDPCDVHLPKLRGEHAPRCASVCGWSHPDHSGVHSCSCYCGKFQFDAASGVRDRAQSAPETPVGVVPLVAAPAGQHPAPDADSTVPA